MFLSETGKSDVILPWSFVARTQPESVERHSRGWLARDDSWDPFYSVSWSTPTSRAPWRILPHGSLRLLVGQGDALERFVFQEGPRDLELVFGSTLVDWSGQEGETIRIQKARLLLSGRELDGLLLDMARAEGIADSMGGDWAFMVSGDSLQLVIENPATAPEGASATPARADSATYRAWARLDFLDTQWPSVAVTWTDTRAYEEARRDVPVAWSLSSGDGELVGSFKVANAWFHAGQGQGPILPVEALYQVRGEVRIQGRAYPVRGFFRHAQG